MPDVALAVWFHVAAALVYMCAALPLALFIAHSRRGHVLAHAAAGCVLVAALLPLISFGAHAPRAGAHGLFGVVYALGMLGIVLLGTAGASAVHTLGAPLVARHVHHTRTLLALTLVPLLTTGLAALVDVDACISAADVVTWALAAAALGYARMARTIDVHTPLPTLLRAYTPFVLESAVLVLAAGAGIAACVIAPSRARVALALGSVAAAGAGAGGFVHVCAEARRAGQVSPAVVRGAPVVAVVLIASVAVLATPAVPAPARGVLVGVALVAACARATRVIVALPPALGVLACTVFLAQERFLGPLSALVSTGAAADTATAVLAYWTSAACVGGMGGLAMLACVRSADARSGAPEHPARARRRRRAAKEHAETDDEHEEEDDALTADVDAFLKEPG